MEYMLLFMLIVFGAAALLESIFSFAALRRAYERRMKSAALFIPVTPRTSDMEYILLETLKMAENYDISCRIILFDMGADSETMEICRKFAEEHEIFELCSGSEVFEAEKLLHFL